VYLAPQQRKNVLEIGDRNIEFLVSCRPFTADEIMQLAYRPPS
jgi:hypothetical protein